MGELLKYGKSYIKWVNHIVMGQYGKSYIKHKVKQIGIFRMVLYFFSTHPLKASMGWALKSMGWVMPSSMNRSSVPPYSYPPSFTFLDSHFHEIFLEFWNFSIAPIPSSKRPFQDEFRKCVVESTRNQCSMCDRLFCQRVLFNNPF